MRPPLSKWLTLFTLASALAACKPDTDTPGQLIVTLATDMAMPSQIDNVRIQVSVRGMTVRDEPFPVGNGQNDFRIPATLTLVEGKDPAPVNVRVLGQKRDKWRTFREVVTTVPSDSVKELRMPIQWLCDEQVRTVSVPTPAGGTETMTLSSCDEGQTCRAGSCMPNMIPIASLPDYVAQNVFGASDDPQQGQCFDTVPCMSRGAIQSPDVDCTVPKPDSPNVNVALRVTSDGICDMNNTVCFVPLDNDKDEGWFETDSGRLKLPIAACGRLKDRIGAVYVSTECTTKTPAIPPCGPWSSVPSTAKSLRPSSSGGSGAELPLPTKIASLLGSNSKDSICCPLMSDGNMLYACTCSADPSSTTVYGIDPATPGSYTQVALLDARNDGQFSGDVFGGAFFWTDTNTLYRTAFPSAGRPAQDMSTPFMLQGSAYPTASLLIDAAANYVLVSGIDGAMGSPVKVLKVDASGAIMRFETGADKGVYQFDQDDAAIYLASDVDGEKDPSSGLYQRHSSVIRIDKASGVSSVVLPERVVTIPAIEHGGYVGVQVDAPNVFALFEDTAAPDGTTHIEVQRVDSSGANPTTIFEDTIDPLLVQINLVGAVDGTLVLSRVEYEKTTAALRVKSSALWALPASDSKRILATFTSDFVMDGLATGAGAVYWLNGSGSIYKLPRTSLR